MRTLLIGLIILQAVALGQENVMTRAQALEFVNLMRSLTARSENIANMNELAYDKSLEKFAKLELTKYTTCPLPEIITVGNIEMFKTENKNLFKDAVSDPGRTRMAFLKSPCGSEEFIGISDTNDNVLILNGEPGSRCPESRPFVNSGLCGVRRGYKRKEFSATGALKTIGAGAYCAANPIYCAYLLGK